MKKTTLYLEPEVDDALARRASEQGISKAELMRRALADAAKPRTRPKLTGAGTFSGPPDLAEKLDEYLTKDGFGEEGLGYG